MKLHRLIVLLVVLAMVPVVAFAQDTGGEAFVLELSAKLAELGWDDDALTGFKEAAAEMDWSGAQNADPELLASALEFGMSDDALTARERAQIAHALTQWATEMTRLGYNQRDVAEAAMQATRSAAGAVTQLRSEAGDLVRERLRDRVNEAMEEHIPTRFRDGNEFGGIYRTDGESVPGIGLNPDGPAGPGSQAGPRDNSADPTGD